MYTIPPKKMLILYILDILKKYSDENHGLSQKEIMEILEREYSVSVDRKAVKRNLINLLDSGYDLEYTETTRKSKNGEEETIYSDWRLNREFTDAELRLLIDSLLFSKAIPYNQCKSLIEKLKGLSNVYFNPKVRHIRSMPEKLPENKELFYTIEVLDEAIAEKKQVAFHYNTYGLDKKPRPRKGKNGEPLVYEVSPYQMAATNGRYYLICSHKRYNNIVNYRVDRISGIRILDDGIVPIKAIKGQEHGLDLPKHMAEHIYMFAGESVKVKLRANRRIIGDILDWFGRDVALSEAGEDEIFVQVQVNAQAMFYWAMQYAEHVEVLEPVELREKIFSTVTAVAEKYN